MFAAPLRAFVTALEELQVAKYLELARVGSTTTAPASFQFEANYSSKAPARITPATAARLLAAIMLPQGRETPATPPRTDAGS